MKVFRFFALSLFALAAFGQSAVVISENANLRGTPRDTGRVVDTLARGSSIDVLKQKGPWFLVQSDDFVGWIHGNTIRLEDLTIETADTTPVLTPQPTPRPLPETTAEPTPQATPEPTPQPRTIAAPEPTTTRSRPSGNYLLGPRGGCYYINSSGKKTYVDRALCG